MRTTLLLLALLLCLVALPAAADTGTYVLERYTVTLTPHATDGSVDLDYYQKWRVTGGSIPWITVGLPNANFTITKSGDAVRTIAPQSEGGWSGVRIDLDRDYQPGQTFEISFSVKQNKLFYADNENYRLDFTPGWYDNAPIENLTLQLNYFVKPESITADPTPTAKTDQALEWRGVRLGNGVRYTLHISFPKAAAPAAIPEGSLKSGEEPGGAPSGESEGRGASRSSGALVFVAFVVFFAILAVVGPFLNWLSWVAGGRKGPYSGGAIFWGGLIDSLTSSGGGDGGSDRSTGGGGGFGGGGFSCACACVSCACACACAGGGGAGCSRKLKHSCPKCEEARNA